MKVKYICVSLCLLVTFFGAGNVTAQNFLLSLNFLTGDPFGEIVEVYGRPRVRTWNLLEFDTVDSAVTPGFAVRELDSVDAGDSLWAVTRRETERHREILERPGLAAHAAALDPDRWEIARFSLWRDAECAEAPNADCVQTYRVA
ncbi:MAG: DUF4865 family protein [Proteobacteria bacterium]|nr:DUF4865 family protein [Pseudomonadota bacterium]